MRFFDGVEVTPVLGVGCLWATYDNVAVCVAVVATAVVTELMAADGEVRGCDAMRCKGGAEAEARAGSRSGGGKNGKRAERKGKGSGRRRRDSKEREEEEEEEKISRTEEAGYPFIGWGVCPASRRPVLPCPGQIGDSV